MTMRSLAYLLFILATHILNIQSITVIHEKKNILIEENDAYIFQVGL